MSFLGKLFGKKEQESLDQGLEKTKQGFFERISKVIVGKTSVDDDVLDQLEEALIGADVGVDTTLDRYPARSRWFSSTYSKKTIDYISCWGEWCR